MTAFRRFGFAVALLLLAGCNQEAETAPTAKHAGAAKAVTGAVARRQRAARRSAEGMSRDELDRFEQRERSRTADRSSSLEGDEF